MDKSSFSICSGFATVPTANKSSFKAKLVYALYDNELRLLARVTFFGYLDVKELHLRIDSSSRALGHTLL